MQVRYMMRTAPGAVRIANQGFSGRPPDLPVPSLRGGPKSVVISRRNLLSLTAAAGAVAAAGAGCSHGAAPAKTTLW